MEFKSQSQRPLYIGLLIGCLCICGAIIFAAVYVGNQKDKDCSTPPSPKPLSGNGEYKYAAVATDAGPCSEIGNEVLARHQGNAVDAAVASLLCIGVVNSHSTGIGGGSFIIVYDKKKGWFAANSRERAPSGATKDMYTKPENKGKSVLGGLASGVPGEVKGLYEVHQRFGSVPWENLVSPSTKLLRDGFILSEVVHGKVEAKIVPLANKTGFEHFFEDSAMTRVKPVGSLIKNPLLAATYQTIADDPHSFYNGTLAQSIAQDVQDRGGIITADDLKDYKVTWKNPTVLELPRNLTVYSMPPPGSGAVISYILSILAGYQFDPSSVASDEAKIKTYHRIVEAMKFAYGKRSALGDEDFVDVAELVRNMTSREFGEQTRARITDDRTHGLDYYDHLFYNEDDSGTSHLSVVDGQGNAVAITSTINLTFGNKVVGSRTGILFNNEMDDFSTPNLTNAFGVPPSESNFIKPGKRPQSSMSPTIVWDKTAGKVRMAVGTSGGTRITTTTAMVIMDALWFNLPLPEAIDKPRFHHQLLPMQVTVEKEFPSVLRKGLEAKGHKIYERSSAMSTCQAIQALDGHLAAVSDYRKGGKPGGY